MSRPNIDKNLDTALGLLERGECSLLDDHCELVTAYVVKLERELEEEKLLSGSYLERANTADERHAAQKHSADLLAERVAHLEAEADVLKRAALERTPDGTQLCYLCDGVLVLLGDPGPEEDEDSPDYHNCDAMGCGTLSHVKERRVLTAEQMERLGRGERVGLSGDGES